MQYKKEDIIEELVKMRIEDMASNKSLLNHIYTKYGYKQTYAYELIKEAREKIREIWKENDEASLNEAIGQMEQMAEDAKKGKNYKLAFEIRKELSKIQGHYTERLEVKGELAIKNIEIVINKSNED
jgi:nucleoid DNA-binding protein